MFVHVISNQVRIWQCFEAKTDERMSSTPTAPTTEPTWPPAASSRATVSNARSTAGSTAVTTANARTFRTSKVPTVSRFCFPI